VAVDPDADTVAVVGCAFDRGVADGLAGFPGLASPGAGEVRGFAAIAGDAAPVIGSTSSPADATAKADDRTNMAGRIAPRCFIRCPSG
jgi:hypothetical protein